MKTTFFAVTHVCRAHFQNKPSEWIFFGLRMFLPPPVLLVQAEVGRISGLDEEARFVALEALRTNFHLAATVKTSDIHF